VLAKNDIYTPDDLANDWILTCQGPLFRPRGPRSPTTWCEAVILSAAKDLMPSIAEFSVDGDEMLRCAQHDRRG